VLKVKQSYLQNGTILHIIIFVKFGSLAPKGLNFYKK